MKIPSWAKGAVITVLTAILATLSVDYIQEWKAERAGPTPEEIHEAKVRKFIKNYGTSGSAYATREPVTADDPYVYVYYKDLMKIPPTEQLYFFISAIGNENGVTLGNGQSNVIPGDLWTQTFYAKDWDDYSTASFEGSGFFIPSKYKPGNYTLLLFAIFYTEYGPIQTNFEPIPFKIQSR